MHSVILHNYRVYRKQFMQDSTERLRPVIQGIIDE
jgi:hypothetical protein